ncbi:MAG: anthranilate phosphoribosyltransferase [Denitrovibrio sp.]|nr:MAG: anthranilate phosphoribosyltransferase [Denitrovibrio sp.]
MSKELIKKTGMGEKLTMDETYNLFLSIMNGEMSEAEIACVLVGMRASGETSQEIAGAAKAMNDKKVKFEIAEKAFDTCGTGGSGKSTMNISSAVALLLASLGKPVVKHGNRAMSGTVGSADIYELAGMPVSADKETMQQYYKKNNFAFLFAPLYHPAMKYAGPVRKQIMIPTIFNFLGPLANPAELAGQIIGIAKRERLASISESLIMLGRSHVALYSSLDGFDEVSSCASTEVYEVVGGGITKYNIDPAEIFDPFEMPVVKTPEQGLEMFMQSISPDGDNLNKLIALNAGLALKVFGDADNIKGGYDIALNAISTGKVLEKYRSL